MDSKRKKKAIESILESLSNGSSIVKACDKAVIDVSTFWHWRKKSKCLEEKVEAIIESRIQVVEDSLYKEAVKGNATLIMFFLQNRAGDKWQDKRHFEGNVSGKVTLVIDNTLDKV